MGRRIKRILKEPLLHFLLLGAGLFIIHAMTSNARGGGGSEEIVVTTGQIEHLAVGFAKTWQRPPTTEELTGLIRDYVRNEVYYREAVAMGLDKNDIVIRRRLRQKMEFISEDIAAQAEPSDADLNAYLQAHPESFRVDQRFTFQQIYLNPEEHGDNLASDAEHLLARLNQPDSQADPSTLGDSFLLAHRFVSMPAGEVVKQFGESFAAKLPELAIGHWVGPVESGYGVHLVLVSARTDGRLPELSEVRDAVRREWENARRREANEQFYKELLGRYTVTIEGLEPTGNQEKVAETK